MFNAFLLTRPVDFHTIHGQNKMSKFDTEGFAPVTNFCGVFGSPYWFTKLLISKTEKYYDFFRSIQNLCTFLKLVLAP